ncbi:hypothetical protein ACPOL_2790 [Acidisarcina polymorpha]|uniref:Rhs-family protein n=2 Tax=Acidisarcina polymorpha TaxID=2211140 RepID=A0A2Z5FZ26_9BACT|nr:hypothetical protein ACPOL_2790 [Acidisarcina polymorpha]
MSDVARWKVRGPVKTLRSEFATWDLDRQDWQPIQHFTVGTFRLDGMILRLDAKNPDGTIAHSQWLYDDGGRLAESNSSMNEGPLDRTAYVYDEGGRHIRTTHVDHDGTQTDVEVCSYEVGGSKTKVRFLSTGVVALECSSADVCGACTGYAVEGTESAYNAPGATTMTVVYDERTLPVKVSFQDADHRLLSYVNLRRDRTGKLLSEEMQQGDKLLFQSHLDQAAPEERERLAAMFEAVLGDAISRTIYRYDAYGRLLTRDHRMGNLGGSSTTYRYNANDDPSEETAEHRSREASYDETGTLHYTSDRLNVQHNRLEYVHDGHGDWTERIVSFRSGSESEFERSNIERRSITYYSS